MSKSTHPPPNDSVSRPSIERSQAGPWSNHGLSDRAIRSDGRHTIVEANLRVKRKGAPRSGAPISRESVANGEVGMPPHDRGMGSRLTHMGRSICLPAGCPFAPPAEAPLFANADSIIPRYSCGLHDRLASLPSGTGIQFPENTRHVDGKGRIKNETTPLDDCGAHG